MILNLENFMVKTAKLSVFFMGKINIFDCDWEIIILSS